MHILFLTTQDLESPSGAGRYFPLAQSLVRMGHKVTLAGLHSNYAALEKKSFSLKGVDVTYVAQMHVRKQGNRKSYYSTPGLLARMLQATWALTRAVRCIPADIVYICKPHPMNSLAGLYGHNFQRKHLVLDCDDYEAANNRITGVVQRWGVKYFEDRMPCQVEQVTAISNFILQRIVSLGVPVERITYLPNGIDKIHFARVDESRLEAVRAKWGLAGKKVVSYIGSLSLPSHPVALLIDAFAAARQSLVGVNVEAVFLIVGRGEEYERLREKVHSMGLDEEVILCGAVPFEETPVYYQVSDACVDPVYDDDAGKSRVPLKMFECWASGVPFITADVGDRRLLAGSPPASYLVEPSDPAAWSEAIASVLTDQGLASSLVQSGLQQAGLYTSDAMARRLEQVFRKALAPDKDAGL